MALLPIDEAAGTWRAPGRRMDGTFRLLATGDFCPTDTSPVCAAFLRGREAAKAVYGDTLSELRAKDLSVTNLELPLDLGGAPTIKSGPCMHAPPEAVEGLLAGGFDMACLANNHMLDYGDAPLLATLDLLAERGIAAAGAGANLEAARVPAVLERAGRRVGVLSIAEHEYNPATRTEAGIAPLEPGTNAADIARLRPDVDLLIVFVHGGNEHCPFPSPRAVREYRSLIDAGADAVIGHHAHCPQGMELHNGRPILYNLGNFLFWKPADQCPYLWLESFFARLYFDGRDFVGLDVHPYRLDAETARLGLLGGEERTAFLRRLNRISGIVADPAEHERFWNAYALSGWAHYRGLVEKYVPRMDSDDDHTARDAACILRNMYTCQAHRDRIVTALELMRLGRDREPFGVEEELAELRGKEER